jgi:hypothetical protein
VRERFQRALDGLQSRFRGPPMVGDEGFTFANEVTFGVSLGEDRTDYERISFAVGIDVPAVAGRFNVAVIEATEDLELTAAYAVRTGGGGDWNWQFLPAGFSGGYLQHLDAVTQRTAEAGSGALYFTGSDALVTQGVQFFSTTQNPLLYVTPDFCVLPAGRAMKLQCENVNTGIRAGFAWRRLAR